MKKRYKALIAISLCLNIFLLGFIAGEIRHFRPQRKSSGIVKEFVETHKEQQQQLNKERKRALNMLAGEDFNQEAYQTQIDIVAEKQKELFKQFSIEAGAKIRAMPKDQRNELIERIQKHRKDHNRPPYARR